MVLQVLAVSAPELPEGGIGSSLTSQDPASLYNACRYAAYSAENQIGIWAESNWAVPRLQRSKSVLLMHSLKEDLSHFVTTLETIRPNLLLIGAMTMCLPGAIACARIAKEMLGDEVCIVLGGRHTSETVYVSPSNVILHHPGSPLRLMAEGYISSCFDIVIAGEGEHIIARLGEVIGELKLRRIPPAHLTGYLERVTEVPGNWILGWYDGVKIITIQGQGRVIDRNSLPTPCEMFGIQTYFDVFDGRPTAHAFSDTGSGCIYNCSFCSEKCSITGPLLQSETAPSRLFRQLKTAVEVVTHDIPGKKASAFVEDSTLLGGSIRGLRQLVELLRQERLDIRWGGQFTIDQILDRKRILQQLSLVGLDYILIGIETLDPQKIGGMSKDVKHSRANWRERTEQALEILKQCNINCGAALLFGLGESQASREELFKYLKQWRIQYNMPHPISLNWAVQHPLKGEDNNAQYRYYEWGIPPGSFIEAFRDFGEASLIYPIARQPQPTINEVRQIRRMYQTL